MTVTPEAAFQAHVANNEFELAEALLRPYIATGQAPLPVWRMLAQAVRGQGRIAEARDIQAMLVDAVPGDLAGRFDLAESLLLLGDFERGWREYRYRYSLPHTVMIARKVQQPRWNGQPIPGRTLLIHDEQGYGDTFQFLQLLPQAARRSGARIVLEINAETLPLAQRSLHCIEALVPRGQLPPPFDVHCELMSLPAALGLRLEDLPGEIPYLFADALRLQKWQARLAGLPRPIVALNWAGRPSHPNDRNRSMAFSDLIPLNSPGASFVSIQKGPAGAQTRETGAGFPILSLGDEITDFDDTAAILSVADVLVSVDSSPIHLAGALGRVAWVLLPLVPDWRWLMERTDSPWYPQHRLFRQTRRGDWSDVIETVGGRISELSAGR